MQERQPRTTKKSTTGSNADETPRRDLRSQVALSLMPEKIRSAVRGGDIAPAASLERYKTAPLPSSSFVPIRSDALLDMRSKVQREELDEKKLKGLTPDLDFYLFKNAWEKAAKVNEEVICSFFGTIFNHFDLKCLWW